jgi:hypothetical protein
MRFTELRSFAAKNRQTVEDDREKWGRGVDWVKEPASIVLGVPPRGSNVTAVVKCAVVSGVTDYCRLLEVQAVSVRLGR